MKDKIIITNNFLEKRIYTIRGVQVMFDRDLAKLYEVETKRLNEQVKRNINRFPLDFMFQLTSEELENWKSQFATSNKELLGLRKMPYVFSEQGVSMLSAVLKSRMAVNTSITIIKAFVEMRKLISSNNLFDKRLDVLEYKQFKTDEKIETILNVIEERSINPSQGIFYDGQVFDAHNFVSDLIRSAKENIILIDNFIDKNSGDMICNYFVLKYFTRRKIPNFLKRKNIYI